MYGERLGDGVEYHLLVCLSRSSLVFDDMVQEAEMFKNNHMIYA